VAYVNRSHSLGFRSYFLSFILPILPIVIREAVFLYRHLFDLVLLNHVIKSACGRIKSTFITVHGTPHCGKEIMSIFLIHQISTRIYRRLSSGGFGLVCKVERDAIDAVAFIGWCLKAFTFEYVPKMAATGGADDFCSHRKETSVFVARYGSGNSIKERRPTTT